MPQSATLTAEQSLALQTRDVSIALAAGAGCGKTFVLTERFLSHLEPSQPGAPDPANLSQLIAITFTDAAAREMRSRIRSKCYQRLEAAHSEADQDYWLRLLRAIEAARVSTIHAFCGSLLRAHAIELGLDPMFGVLDQGDADVLESEAIDDVLRRQLAALDDATLDLADLYGLARVKQQVARLLRQRYEPSFAEWQGASPEQICDAWQACYDRVAFSAAIGDLADRAPMNEIIAMLQAVSIPAAKPKFIEAKAVLLDLLPRVAAGSVSPDELCQLRALAGVRNICAAVDWPSRAEFERYKNACAKLRKLMDDCQLPPFDRSAAEETARLGLLALHLAADVAQEYSARKAAQNKLDFDDLLALAYRLLTDPAHAAVQKRLSGELRLLLVDEFQDTDQLQVELVKALCGDGFDTGRLFFVGDVKQSIYRFRGAQPEVFRGLRGQVQVAGRLPLTTNFRSQPAILHFVNALFADDFGADYDPLRPHRDQVTPEPAIEFLWTITPNKNNRQIKGATQDARRQEARWIARRLRALIDGGEPIIAEIDPAQPAGTRPLRLGDIAILFRALSDVQVYEEALRDYGLDYYLVGGHAFYAQQEIFDLLNLLRATASAADEISLAGALRSPLFSLADETLFWLVESAGSLNAGLLAARLPEQLSAIERSKAAHAAATIRHLRASKEHLPVAALIHAALAQTGYDAVLLAEFLGERKLANLEKLIEQARSADQGGVLDLDGFITQLSQFVAEGPKEALAATSPETADVIRLMTIHHAKGLEFPLVVVPDLDRQPRGSSQPAALHAELGPLVPPPPDDEAPPAAVGMTLYNLLERREEAEERKRLLYVAATRAADYLLLTSSLEAFDQPKSDWMRLIARRFDLESGRLVATLPSGYETPLVRVTDSEPATAHKPAGRTRGPDLTRMLEEAHQLAAAGGGVLPAGVSTVPVDEAARRQFSFSRLSGRLVRPDEALVVAATAAETETTDGVPSPAIEPRGLGSLVHSVLERIDFAADAGPSIARWCRRLSGEHFHFHAAAEPAAEAAADMLARFIGSPRGRELADAAALHREIEFLLAWPPGDRPPANNAGRELDARPASLSSGPVSPLYLQGYIDCLYQDRRGEWRLVDYKTSDVRSADVRQAAERYQMQLYVYAMAVETALGVTPAELTVCFLRPGVEHTFPWDDAARRRARQLVDDALATGAGGAAAGIPRQP